MDWQPAGNRYETMLYNRCGRSGLKLPAISLGLWHNFGDDTPHLTKQAICRKAFDLGITHFDLANNYGPPPGSAEAAFGDILRTDFAGLRDELVLSTKAGYLMWTGPYGEWGSRKYMLSSLDQSLKRLGVDYVDIFYSHRYDPDTPLEETMLALDHAVRSGKALYVGISSYNSQRTREAAAILGDLGTPFIIHQPSYSPDQPLGRGGRAARHAVRPRPRLDRLLAARPGHAHRQISAGHSRRRRAPRRASRSTRPSSTIGTSPTSAPSTRSPSAAARRWRRWRSPGCCAAAASPRRWSAPAGLSSSRTASARFATSLSRQEELDEIDRYAREADINLWAASAERKGPPRKK